MVLLFPAFLLEISKSIGRFSETVLADPDMSEREKRGNERYGLELPITVHWRDVSGTEKEATGTTKNISKSRVYVFEIPLEFNS